MDNLLPHTRLPACSGVGCLVTQALDEKIGLVQADVQHRAEARDVQIKVLTQWQERQNGQVARLADAVQAIQASMTDSARKTSIVLYGIIATLVALVLNLALGLLKV